MITTSNYEFVIAENPSSRVNTLLIENLIGKGALSDFRGLYFKRKFIRYYIVTDCRFDYKNNVYCVLKLMPLAAIANINGNFHFGLFLFCLMRQIFFLTLIQFVQRKSSSDNKISTKVFIYHIWTLPRLEFFNNY